MEFLGIYEIILAVTTGVNAIVAYFNYLYSKREIDITISDSKEYKEIKYKIEDLEEALKKEKLEIDEFPEIVLDSKDEQFARLYVEDGEPKEVELLFATDRNLTGSNSVKTFFGILNDELSFGTCRVSIPPIHRLGELERPLVNWKILERPGKHIILKEIIIHDTQTFYNKIRSDLRNSETKNAFIFVHGYNVTFYEAAIRTAQLTYDLKFNGTRVLYSWPSAGKLTNYNNDGEEKVVLSEIKLIEFLNDFFNTSDAENIYLIGHSMGTRALSGAISKLIIRNPNVKQRLKEIILSAPDINVNIFKKIIAPNLISENKRITVYASSADVPLKVSRKLNKGKRVGESGQNIFIMDGVNTIDATGLDTDFFGHSYFAQHQMVLSDINNLIKTGDSPDKRMNLTRIETTKGKIWKFNRGAYT